jgi:hypothetical protein
MSQGIKIAVVSKEDHCKPHMKRLMKEGHAVDCLGSHVSAIPDSYDVIVCRLSSCSHGASDACRAAKRKGRAVFFEDSVTGIMTELRRYIREKKLGGVDDLDRSPVKGIFHRAYWHSNTRCWVIRRSHTPVGPWSTHIESFKDDPSRSAVRARVLNLDEAVQEEQGLVKTTQAGVASAAVMKAALEISPEPDEPVANEPEPDEADQPDEADKADQPDEPMADSGDATPQENLYAILQMLYEEMDKQELTQITNDEMGLTIYLQPMHLNAPSGAACAAADGRRTSDISEITCSHCKSSEFYATASWVLANLGRL